MGEKDIILVAKMYTGEYINENIGHEIINFFKPDNEECYYGYIIHNGKVKNCDRIKTILLVSDVKDKKVEIIAKIDDPEFISNQNDDKSKQKQYIEDNNIRYGGVLLSNIRNTTDDYGIYITYKTTKKIKELKEKYYILLRNNDKEGDNHNIKVSWNIGHQYGYIYKGGRDEKDKVHNTDKDYKEICNFIEDKRIWRDKECPRIGRKIMEKYEKLYDDRESFLDIIEKNYDETIFSNMLYYYFNDKKMFKDFAKEVLNINTLSDNIRIEKEKATDSDSQKGRIDIWCEDEKNCIVIENKIKSGINGRYYDSDINDKSKEEKIKNSQLTKYKEWVRNGNKKNKLVEKYEKEYYFIFVPNYKQKELEDHIRENNLMPTENDKPLYRIITYREIFKFFNEEELKRKMENKDDKYLDFLKALSKHIYAADEEMERKFVSAIRSCQKDEDNK